MIEKLHKLMIDATGFGYYQADDADPTEAVCEYSKARAREDALLEALKQIVSIPAGQVDTSYRMRLIAKEAIRKIEASR